MIVVKLERSLKSAKAQPKWDVQSEGVLQYNQTWFHHHIWDTNERFGVVDMTGVPHRSLGEYTTFDVSCTVGVY